MKFKDRIRKAVFQLFQPEIMRFTAPQMPIPYVLHEVPFTVLTLERIVQLKELQNSNLPPYYFFETMKEEIKHEFWDKITKCIHVDTTLLSDRYPPYERKIRFLLRIQKPRDEK